MSKNDIYNADAAHDGSPSRADYGTPRHSGRYPWGSGDNPYQRNQDFMARYSDYKAKGYSNTEIAREMGISTTTLRAKISMASSAELAANRSRAQKLKDKGYSNVKIGEMMGYPESTIRTWLKANEQQKIDATKATSDMLKRELNDKRMLDIGVGVERDLNIPRGRLDTAVEMLKEEGYTVETIQIEQATMPGQYTTIKVLAEPGLTKGDIYKDRENIQSITEYSPDGGGTFTVAKPPESISGDRVLIRYKEEGGIDKDGVIELRRGVDDLDLGQSSYAQVRIAVDGTHYLKGMAMYGNDIPEGYDVVFNTNKPLGTDKYSVLKKLKDDPDNPFGATIKANGQYEYEDENGVKHLGAINKVNEEGDWGEWSKSLSSQMLSKQPMQLINRQLDLAYKERADEYNDIMALTQPAVKQKLLDAFASNCDSASVDLKAAALPRQQSHVILPITDLKETEIYAPNYSNGEHVVLIRYPHGGTFEIPELVVNNKHKTAKDLLGDAADAVGINSKVAERLSGADFDGDTVLVIPVNDNVRVKTSPALAGLKDFDPKGQYPEYPGMTVISAKQKQTEMGKVSNLITDMTLKGATNEELERAVKHSMVVIDAEKHHLNYKQSEIDNDIAGLKTKYQGGPTKGASTLISKASSDFRIPERELINPKTGKKGYSADPETGEYVYRETGRTYMKKYTRKDGSVYYKETPALEKTTKMAATNDANTLSSGTPQEQAYANYANKLKALANKARKESLAIETVPVDPKAKDIYKNEVASLNTKLNDALKNAPRERQAQIAASVQLSKKLESNPELASDKEHKKKESERALASARVKYGAGKKKVQVQITDKEWEAIQAGAISTSKLKMILNNTDLDTVKKYATPRNSSSLSSSKVSRIKAMAKSGYTNKEIADILGVSTSTVSDYLKQ